MLNSSHPSPAFLYRHRLYQRLLSHIRPCRTLEIGPGTGYLLPFLTQNSFWGDAVDSSAPALAVARRRQSGFNLIHTPFERFTSPTPYSLILCFETLQYVPHPSRFLSHVTKHLKPGGILLLSVPAHSAWWNRQDVIHGHRRRFDRPDLEKLLSRHHFRVDHWYSFGFPILNLFRLINRTAWLTHPPYHPSLTQEYPPFLRHLLPPWLLHPLFWIMDQFLSTNLGIGYLVQATYSPHNPLPAAAPRQSNGRHKGKNTPDNRQS